MIRYATKSNDVRDIHFQSKLSLFIQVGTSWKHSGQIFEEVRLVCVYPTGLAILPHFLWQCINVSTPQVIFRSLLTPMLLSISALI